MASVNARDSWLSPSVFDVSQPLSIVVVDAVCCCCCWSSSSILNNANNLAHTTAPTLPSCCCPVAALLCSFVYNTDSLLTTFIILDYTQCTQQHNTYLMCLAAASANSTFDASTFTYALQNTSIAFKKLLITLWSNNVDCYYISTSMHTHTPDQWHIV